MEKSDEALMHQLQRDNIAAFEALVKRWEKPLLNHCYRIIHDIELAEDLRQEIFLRIYRSAKMFRGTAQFSTWMYRIATNLCLNTLTKQQRRKEILMDYPESASEGFDARFIDPSDAPDTVAVKKETENRVRSAVVCLPEKLRVVIVMRHYKGMTFQEIANILGCPVSTIKSRGTTGMGRLQQMLAKRK